MNDVSAMTITVDDDGGADYSTITDAIDAAHENDTIYVRSGEYHEEIVVDKQIEIIGNGSGTTSIMGNVNRNVVEILSNGVNFSGFTISGGVDEFYQIVPPYASSLYVDGDNCQIQHNILIEGTYGLSILGSSNVIRKNSCLENFQGITVFGNENRLEENHCENNVNGIRLTGSSNNVVIGNVLSNSSHWGGNGLSIGLASDHNVIQNNTCNNNYDNGMDITDSHHNLVENNSCEMNKRDGITLNSCSNTIFRNNVLVENSINISSAYPEYWSTNLIGTSNTINGLPIIYLTDSTDMEISSPVGAVILVHCDNIIVSNIDFPLSSGGIQVILSSNITITNTIISGNSWCGIRIEKSDYCRISNNDVSENMGVGIYLVGSNENEVISNFCNLSEGYGIAMYGSDDNGISLNECNYNKLGILLSRSLRNNISGNEFIGNQEAILEILFFNQSLGLDNEFNDNFIDTDADGIVDSDDMFPTNDQEWSDRDDDGVGDNSDAFPDDPAASIDSDGDGYPEEWNRWKSENYSTTGLKLDAYPDDPERWEKKNEDGEEFILGFEGAIFIASLAISGLARYRKRLSIKRPI
jgi:nitrous oxidase accessory protein